MIAPDPTVKTFGILAGFLLFGYAFAISKLARYDTVSNKYASAFATVGFMLILAAAGGFASGFASLTFEGGSYTVGAIGATAAFVRIIRNEEKFKKA